MKDRFLTIFVYVFVTIFALFCLIPFWIVLVGSFTSEASFLRNGYQLWPDEFSLEAYNYLLSGQQFFRSFSVTVFVTVVGTFLALFVTATFSYVLAHRKVKYRNIMAFATYITMIFGTGLVGFYILISNWLGLRDSIWALILPYLLNPFFAFIFVSFFRSLPYELNESATIDGAGEWRIFFTIILPICTPVIATIGLFYSLQYWNDWWLALLFIDDYKLQPLQIMIRQLLSNINLSAYVGGAAGSYQSNIPANVVQMATVCLTIGPIIFVYPFVQRYFVNGLTIGAVKG